MIRELVIHMAVSEPKDPTWFAALESILQTGKGGPYWSDFPTLMIQLVRSDLERGAMTVFLAVFIKAATTVEGVDGIFHKDQNKGDQRCMSSINFTMMSLIL